MSLASTEDGSFQRLILKENASKSTPVLSTSLGNTVENTHLSSMSSENIHSSTQPLAQSSSSLQAIVSSQVNTRSSKKQAVLELSTSSLNCSGESIGIEVKQEQEERTDNSLDQKECLNRILNPSTSSKHDGISSLDSDSVQLPKSSEEPFSEQDEDLRKKLKIHFIDPFSQVCREKQPKKRIPEKLILLVLKFFFVTTQLLMFGHNRANFATFLDRNNVAMKHLLLKDWSPDYEVMPYPPSTGVYAVYNIDELLQHINYTVKQLYHVPSTAVGSFFIHAVNDTDDPLSLCIKYYKKGIFNVKDSSLELDTTIVEECKDIGINSTSDYGFNPTIQDLMRSTNGVLVRLLEVQLKFTIYSVNLDMKRKKPIPQCYKISGMVVFDNYDINGQIPVDLKTSIKEFMCTANGVTKAKENTFEWVVFCCVILLSLLSTFFSVHSFIGSIIMERRVANHFKDRSKKSHGKSKSLSFRGKYEILKGRDLLIICSDILTLIGSIMKISLDEKAISHTSTGYDVCGILLGSGCLLVWFGVLHYLAYDPKFNLLFTVIQRSAWTVIRFLLCIVLLFMGFTLCGWVVLGPYHAKFLTLANAFYCLVSMVEGDELYVTFVAIADDKPIIWWFNATFNMLFYAIFSLIALNIFIAIFNSAYESIKKKKDKSDLMEFLNKDDLYECDKSYCQKGGMCYHGSKQDTEDESE